MWSFCFSLLGFHAWLWNLRIDTDYQYRDIFLYTKEGKGNFLTYCVVYLKDFNRTSLIP